MTRFERYTGNSPMRVSKDAKYTVTTGGAIRLEYQESHRVRYLLTTDDHEALAVAVNDAKEELTGRKGGAFYINEFRSVLVPDGQGGRCFWVGNYEDTLVFREGSLEVSPSAPAGLRPGDRWPGPHVGIPYVLNAGATDLRYEKIDGRRRETVFLSDDVGAAEARRTAEFVSSVKGTSGGRVFINEEWELFAPVGIAGDWDYLYIGRLSDENLQWFAPPPEFPLP
jgi:hypothetical protein